MVMFILGQFYFLLKIIIIYMLQWIIGLILLVIFKIKEKKLSVYCHPSRMHPQEQQSPNRW